jgi:hypothetical protein
MVEDAAAKRRMLREFWHAAAVRVPKPDPRVRAAVPVVADRNQRRAE